MVMQIFLIYSALKNSLSWVECFSAKLCENGCEADSERQKGDGGIFKNMQAYFGTTVYE